MTLTENEKKVLNKYSQLSKTFCIKTTERYLKGKITLSEAAARAEMTLWEMEGYLVELGYKSSYSIEDLEKEANLIK